MGDLPWWAVPKEIWHKSGAKESVRVLSGEALRQCLQAAFSGRDGIEEFPPPPPGSIRDPSIPLVTVDEEGFDCRVGDRARRRKRVAHSTFDGDSPEPDPKPGSTASGAEKKRGRPPTLQLAAKGKKLAPSGLSKAARGPTPKARSSIEASPAKAAMSPGKLPPGWQLLTKKRSVGRQIDKTYVSPEGVKFTSWKKVVEHCIGTGVPLPHNESDDDEVQHPPAMRSYMVSSSMSPGKLPPGWQLLTKKRSAGKHIDKTYVSPEGVKFTSWKKVVEHCIGTGIPLPHNESDDDEDTIPSSTAQVRSWLLAAAATGSLPKARQFQYAALRARKALSIAPSDMNTS